MKKLSLLFILFIAILTQVNSQNVYQGLDLSDQNQKTAMANGDHAFVMVTGGNGTTGWSKMIVDPIGFEILAPNPTDLYFLGGDFGADGQWYVTEYSGGFYVVDTITANYTLLATWSETISGFTYSPAHDTYFACSGSKLFTVDMDTYTLELIGPMGNSGNMVGIGADFRGNLWGIDTNDDKLYSIDPITALASPIGESGFNYDYLQGCTYDKTNDIMYHCGFWVAPSVHGGLFTYDLETGAASEFATFPSNQEVTVTSFPWEMPASGSISGLVSDASNGNPVANVELTLEPTDGSNGTNVMKITTDDGLYEFGMVLPGEYKITAVSASFAIQVEDNITVIEGDELVIDFELTTASNSALFMITNTDDDPIEGAMVEFAGQSGETGSDGSVSFENIASGTYSYTANYTGFYEGFGDLEIVEGDYEASVILHELDNVPIDFVIMEEATGTWCGPCALLSPNIDEVYEAGYPISVIAYHASDDYQNEISEIRNGYYGVVAYPTLTFMGQDQIVGFATYDALVDMVENYTDLETPIELGFSNLMINELDQSITGNVMVSNRGPINSEHMKLQIALVENHIPEEWQGLSELNFVERTMYPDADGTALDLVEIGTESIELNLDMSEILDTDHAQIVVFVQDHFTKQIYNGLRIDCSTITGIEEGNNQTSPSIFPNPAQDRIQIKSEETIQTIKIYNMNGQIVLEAIAQLDKTMDLNIEPLLSGVYMIQIETENSSIIKKLIKK